jgi:hypothetical protein
MAFLVGTDEAGYGPNLGPLVISASVWHVPDDMADGALYRRLEAAVTAQPRRAAGTGAPRVVIADSKLLYHSGQGLRLLELGLWAAWWAEQRTLPDTLATPACAQEKVPGQSPIPNPQSLIPATPANGQEKVPGNFAAVWQRLAGESAAGRHAALCDACDALRAPLDADPQELRRLGPTFDAALAAAGVRLLALESLAIFPAELNEALRQYGSKGEALSRWTLGLLTRVIAPLGDERIQILCDKHGGRNHYLPLLVEFFPDHFIQSHGEGRQRSVYRFGPGHRRVEICFQAKGESHLPTALASMASKYLRELAMRALNAFWGPRVPGLRPTAGYPQDARRFRDDIAATQRELGIEDRILWRVK